MQKRLFKTMYEENFVIKYLSYNYMVYMMKNTIDQYFFSFQHKDITSLDIKEPPPGKMGKNEGSPLLADEKPSQPGVLCCTIL